MAIKWGDAVAKGLKFAIHPKRWLMFFIIDLVFLGGIAVIVLSNLSAFTAVLAALATDPMAGLSLLGNVAWIILLLIIWMLLRIGVTGAIIHQSFKEKDPVKKSCLVCWKRYLPLLVAMLIVGIITTLVGWIPYVGWLITIIFSLVFFFVFQGVIIKGSGAIKAIKESWKIFRGSPLKVFLMWLIIALIAGAIGLIFALPALGMVTALMFSAGEASGAAALAAILFSVMANPLNFIAVFLIFLVGSAISTCFSLKATTEYYLQIRKRFKL